MKKYVVIRLQNNVIQASKMALDFNEAISVVLKYVKMYKHMMSSDDERIYTSILTNKQQVNFKDSLNYNIKILIERLDND